MVYCDYINCESKKSYGVPRFAIPNDNRREKWLLNSGNSYSLKLILNERMYICANHFDKKYVSNSKFRPRLSTSAIPVMYINGSDGQNHEHFTCENSSKNSHKQMKDRHGLSRILKHPDLNNKRKFISGSSANARTCSRANIPALVPATTTNIVDEFTEESVKRSNTPLKTYSNVFKNFEGTEGPICQVQFPSPPQSSDHNTQIDSEDLHQRKILIDDLLKSPGKKIEKPEADCNL